MRVSHALAALERKPARHLYAHMLEHISVHTSSTVLAPLAPPHWAPSELCDDPNTGAAPAPEGSEHRPSPGAEPKP